MMFDDTVERVAAYKIPEVVIGSSFKTQVAQDKPAAASKVLTKVAALLQNCTKC